MYTVYHTSYYVFIHYLLLSVLLSLVLYIYIYIYCYSISIILDLHTCCIKHRYRIHHWTYISNTFLFDHHSPRGSGHELQPTDSLPACAWELLRRMWSSEMAMYCSNMLLKYLFNIHLYLYIHTSMYIYLYIYTCIHMHRYYRYNAHVWSPP